MIVSSVIGSLAATLITLLDFQLGLVTAAFGILLSVLMIVITFGKYNSLLNLVRDSLILWGIGILLGGIMTFLLSFGEPVYLDYGKDYAPLFAICVMLSLGVIRIFSGYKVKKTVKITIKAAGEFLEIIGLSDSGNVARDPFSSLPVVIVSQESLGNVGMMLLSDDTKLKHRVIPIDGIGGHTVMRGFVPDEITIEDKPVGAVIAVDVTGEKFAGYDALVPAVLCSY